MNYDQLTGIFRALAPVAVGYSVSKGWLPAGAAGDVMTAIAAIGAAGWSYVNNMTPSGKAPSEIANPPATSTAR